MPPNKIASMFLKLVTVLIFVFLVLKEEWSFGNPLALLILIDEVV